MTSIAVESFTSLFDVSWTVYSVERKFQHSDRFQGLLHNQNALRNLARNLKRFLVPKKGPILEDGDSDSDKVGGLQHVQVIQIKNESAPKPDERLGSQGIVITLTYERGSYKAALFRGTKDKERQLKDDGSIPALLLRMPAPLAKRFLSFLNLHFEVSVTPIKIPTPWMYRLLGLFLSSLFTIAQDQPKEDREDLVFTVVKDLRISFSFEAPISPQLRLLEVNLPHAVLCECLERRCQESFRDSRDHETNFVMEALAEFLDQHTGLQIPRTGQLDGSQLIKVAKIACGAFVLSVDGKIKLMSKALIDGSSDVGAQIMQSASDELLNAIVEIAAEQEG